MRDKKAQKIKEIFKHMYYAGPISCADLSQLLGKSQPNTMMQLNEMLRNGFIVETGQAPSTGGRKPQMYNIRQDLFYILSVALDQFIARLVVVDLQNNFVTTPAEYELKLLNNPTVIHDLAKLIQDYIGSSGIERSQLAGIGIGMPGFIETLPSLLS